MNHYKAFDEQWFKKHQRGLLWLVNSFFTRRWFRWVLRIRKCDLGYRGVITELMPYAYTVYRGFGDGQCNVVTDFRTHPKYAKRLYYAFKSVWWIVHFWDWLIADRFLPRHSFGFSTLTVYPDPNPETNTFDGSIQREGVDETFSTIRGGAGISWIDSGTSGQFTRLDSTSTSNQYQTLLRSVFLFDTSALTATAIINTATLSLEGTGKQNGLGSPDLHIAGATTVSNTGFNAADFAAVSRTSFSSISYASYSTTAYNDFSLNASGVANISKVGISKFSAQSNWDINNSFTGIWVSFEISSLSGKFADSAGTSSDPKLVIDYSIPNVYFKNYLRPRIFGPGLAR